MRSVAGTLFSRRKRATSAGASASVATSATLACARSASALKVATPGRDVALAALRHDAGGRLREPRLDLEPARRFVAGDAERAADVGEDRLARVHFTAPLLAAPLALEGRALRRGEVAIFASSRRRSGAERNRPLPRPTRCSARTARPVAKR